MPHMYFKVIDQLLLLDIKGSFKTGDEIVKEAKAELSERIRRNQLPKGKILKIYGKTNLLLSYMIADQLKDLYSVIAVSDPHLNSFVVVISSLSNYPVGGRISFLTGQLEALTHGSPCQRVCSLNWDQDSDILQVKLKRRIRAKGDLIVRDVFEQLNQPKSLINRQLTGGKFLLIDGRCPILVGFVLANHFADLYKVIAINDIRMATYDAHQYVVAISHNPGRSVGDKIPVLTIE